MSEKNYKLTFSEDNTIAVISVTRQHARSEIVSSETIYAGLKQRKFMYEASKKEIDQKLWNFLKSRDTEIRFRIYSDLLLELLKASSVRVTDDEMQAYISVAAGPSLSGRLTVPLLQRVLKNAGVIAGMLNDSLEDIVATLNNGPGIMNGVLAAEGVSEVFATDGQVVLSGKFGEEQTIHLKKNSTAPARTTDFSVNYGDVLVTLIPGQKGREGMTVTGKKIWSPDNSKTYKSPSVTVSRNVKEVVSPSKIEYRAECEGKAFFIKNSIIDVVEIINSSVSLKVSKDNMTGSVILRGPLGGTPLRMEDVQKLIAGRDIVGIIPVDDIDRLIRDLNEENQGNTREMIIAEGIPPVNGLDEDIVWHVNIDYVYVPIIDSTGAADYRAGRTLPFVRKGETAGVLKPATKGEAEGTDVFGMSIPARDGSPLNMDWEACFEQKPFTENGREYVSLIAASSGLVQKEKNHISIIPVFETKTVDYSTGDIDFDGSVIIKESVADGFTVKATGDIHVKGSVGSCSLLSGGSVIVTGGMNGRKKGHIKAKGDIIIRFAENCSLFASGKILVESHVLLASLVSLDEVIIGKKKKNGRIIGSRICAYRSVTANHVGSHTADASMLWAGVRKNVYDAYLRYEKIEQKIQNALAGMQIQLNRKGSIPPEMSAKLNSKLGELKQKHREVSIRKSSFLEKSFAPEDAEGVGVTVINSIRENTLVRICRDELELLSAKDKTRFVQGDTGIVQKNFK